MNRIIILFSLIVLTASSYPDDFEKKLNKAIRKIWKTKTFDKKKVSVPDSVNIELYSIYKKSHLLGYFSINKVPCRLEDYEHSKNINLDNYDNFWCLSIFDTNLEIKKIQILEYNSEYGFEICSKSWLKQFSGKYPSEVIYSKNIDAVSGATMSGNAITHHIKYLGAKLQTLRKLKII